MNSGNTDLTSWAEKELRLINHIEVFQNKPAILKKVESRLIALQKSLEEEINPATLPQGVDLTRNQIARGENHNGFPYLSLDYPQNFSKTEMFTMRTLFWWGHYLGISLILKGKNLENYVSRLLENQNTEAFKDIYVSLAPNPFEWEINETNFSLIHQSNAKELKKTITALDYLKIIRVYPVTNEKFMTLNWTQVGIQFWKDLTPITLS
ncbi:MAG: hypothetical protein H8E55_11110 [Pelagibacterales bacterium]|nr:hypothetical protein [Pelagibacterales bacterium]